MCVIGAGVSKKGIEFYLFSFRVWLSNLVTFKDRKLADKLNINQQIFKLQKELGPNMTSAVYSGQICKRSEGKPIKGLGKTVYKSLT